MLADCTRACVTTNKNESFNCPLKTKAGRQAGQDGRAQQAGSRAAGRAAEPAARRAGRQAGGGQPGGKASTKKKCGLSLDRFKHYSAWNWHFEAQ